MSKTIKVIILAFVFILLAGCAAPANYLAMVVKPTETTIKQNKRLQGKIAVIDIIGGQKTNPLWVSKVSNEDFKKALEFSLDAYKYLASSSDKAKYKIKANLLNLDQPVMGFELNVKSTVAYKMYGSGVDKTYSIEAIGNAGTSDAFIATERLKIANERSIRENIEEFIRQLSNF